MCIKYLDLAGATHRGWSSVITPLPMGVGRKGSPLRVTRCCISACAPLYAAPNKSYSTCMNKYSQLVYNHV